MLTEAAASRARTLDDPRTRRILRLVISVTLAIGYSCYVGWSYSFVLVSLVIAIMAMVPRAPSPGLALWIVAKIIGSVWLGTVLMLPLHNLQIFGLALVGFMLFVCFYLQAQGKVTGLDPVILIIGVTLVPAFGQSDLSKGIEIAKGFSQGALALFPIIWITFALLPEPMFGRFPKAPRVEGTSVDRAILALQPVVVLLPLFVFMLSSDNNFRYLAGYFQVALIAQHANRSTAKALTVDLIYATVIGSVGGLIVWWIMKLWPTLLWFMLVMALVTFLLASRIFSDGPRGLSPHYYRWSYGLTTLAMIVLPIAMSQGFTGDDAGSRFVQRILDYLLIAAYSVFALLIYDAIVERLSALRERFARRSL